VALLRLWVLDSGHDADGVVTTTLGFRALGSIGLKTGLFAYIALRKHRTFWLS
jgi:hypothetical protein